MHVPATGTSIAIKCIGHAPSLNTALRAELSAIHSAVTHLPKGPSTLLTDSLTSIFLLQSMLHRPHPLQQNKHADILTQIIQALLVRETPLHIYKVRAHRGIAGNEAADAIAKQAATLSPSPLLRPSPPGIFGYKSLSPNGRAMLDIV